MLKQEKILAKTMGKSLKVVITFNTPTDAFAFEASCKKNNIPGRLLPVPVTLTSGCGIGWSCEVSDREILKFFIEGKKLAIKMMTELEF